MMSGKELVFVMNDLPGYVWLLVLIAVIGMPVATSIALFRGAIATGLGRRTATVVAVTTAAVWGGWLVASALLARAEVYRQDPAAANPWIPVALLGSLGVGLLAIRIPVVARILADPGTPARLAMPQTFRVIGATFLIVMVLGELPAVFAIPAGVGDVAVGLTAPFIAWRLARGTGRRGAVWFNTLGIVDLMVAVGLGVLTGLGPSQVIHASPSTLAVTLLPLALIPTTAVPLAIALHVISLRRLGTKPEGRDSSTTSEGRVSRLRV
jgi:hypothetical protein